jgi:hypothetical protein
VLLFKAGAQDPVIPLFDVVGNDNKVPPEQMAGTWVKVGVDVLFTIMFKALLIAKGTLAHDALLVSSQVITSPLMFALLV